MIFLQIITVGYNRSMKLVTNINNDYENNMYHVIVRILT